MRILDFFTAQPTSSLKVKIYKNIHDDMLTLHMDSNKFTEKYVYGWRILLELYTFWYNALQQLRICTLLCYYTYTRSCY